MPEHIFFHYDVAYKANGMEKFKIVKPPHYGWIADPFLINYEDELYLFAEIFLYKSERCGVIGYAKFKDNHFSDWTVTLDKHWHLSYPNVYIENGKLYMCPEAYQSEEVSVYELVAFPDKWKKVKTYITNVEYCDSTFLNIGDTKYMFTFERKTSGSDGNGLLCSIVDDKVKEKKLISNSPEGARPAGNIIRRYNKYIRVAQNCVPSYGSGLIFFEIDELWPEYREHEIKRLTVSDIQSEWVDKYCGIHTYNEFDGITVVDLKKATYSNEEYEAQQRVRQVFKDKYR